MSKKLKFVFFAYESYPYPLAKHLIDEGHEVIIGVIKSINELELPGVKDDESAKEKQQRLSVYDGIVLKNTFGQVLTFLQSVPKAEKGDYFLFFDHSNLYNISETCMKMGFKNGLFPTKWYYRMERERILAKKYVEDNYPELHVSPSFDFKTIKDGIAHMESNEECVYVLKSNGNVGKTVVPTSDDVEVCREMITGALEKGKSDYESGGFLLEEKITNALEVTPIMVFYNGEYVYSLVELENKEFGAGNIGVQKGGSQGLNVRTPQHCEMNEIAFPPCVYELAKKQPGLAIFDVGLLYDGEKFFFTEFCAMRYGWDGMFSECVMRDDDKPFVGNYFQDIIDGKNPLINEFGASVRLFNLHGKGEYTYESPDDIDVDWSDSAEDNLFWYLIKQKGDDIVTAGGPDHLCVATGASDVLSTAVALAYQAVDAVNFEKLYYRPKFDFLSMDYDSSILNRYAAIKPFIVEETGEEKDEKDDKDEKDVKEENGDKNED